MHRTQVSRPSHAVPALLPGCRRASLVLRACLALGLLGLAACGRCSQGGSSAGPLPPPDAVYTVRAKVVALPSPRTGGDLLLHHEAIADFRDAEGERTGMESMTMPFTPAEDLRLEGIRRGDAVRVTFEVRWNAQPTLRVVRIEKLPADTRLKLGEPQKGHGVHGEQP